MRHVALPKSNERPRLNPWQWGLIAVCALILCSCRSPEVNQGIVSRQAAPQGQTSPVEASGVALAAAEMPVAEPDQGVEQNQAIGGPWAPPGIGQPWPTTEYLRDGGTGDHSVAVDKQGRVAGLGAEDTVAHYNTLDGRTVTQPSNEVHIYSPRFAAVRQVVGPAAAGELQRLDGIGEKQKLDSPTSLQLAAKAKQNIQPDDRISTRPAVTAYSKQGNGAVSNVIQLRSFDDHFKPYEDLSVVRLGKFKGTESAFLARGATAAAAWSHIESVRVILDSKFAEAAIKYDKSLSFYTAELPPGQPQLQLVKLASTVAAKPGETVDFTLRFDNVGPQPLANVTILDSLSGRLEFLPDSAECNVAVKVSTHPNESESVVVRCELVNPLLPGQGGILRFRCVVR
jgi:uncharacterized repeat protein (TIGR01451 family)